MDDVRIAGQQIGVAAGFERLPAPRTVRHLRRHEIHVHRLLVGLDADELVDRIRQEPVAARRIGLLNLAELDHDHRPLGLDREITAAGEEIDQHADDDHQQQAERPLQALDQ